MLIRKLTNTSTIKCACEMKRQEKVCHLTICNKCKRINQLQDKNVNAKGLRDIEFE